MSGVYRILLLQISQNVLLRMIELALHIMDIIQNSIIVNANRIELRIYENHSEDILLIEIIDNGYGIDPASVNEDIDPFFTTMPTQKVGIGLSLFKHVAEQCGGAFHIESESSVGTRIVVTMKQSHTDRQPMGDIAGVMALIISENPEIDFVYKHSTEEGEFIFDTKQIKRLLEDTPITHPKVLRFIREIIQENLTEINMYQ
jgi:anti-sigma regulatory factor (Ser/Thr protein kinase)